MNDANPAAAAAGFAYTGWGRQQDLRNDPQVLFSVYGFSGAYSLPLIIISSL